MISPLGMIEGSVLKSFSKQRAADCFTTSKVSLIIIMMPMNDDDCSASKTKFCHLDFVLKYVVIGGEKDFQEESGLFRDLFWSRSGPFVAICTKMQNCLK